MNLYQIESTVLETVNHGNDSSSTNRNYQTPKWVLATTVDEALSKSGLMYNDKIRIENVRLVSSDVIV